jgi:hypothetical protein
MKHGGCMGDITRFTNAERMIIRVAQHGIGDDDERMLAGWNRCYFALADGVNLAFHRSGRRRFINAFQTFVVHCWKKRQQQRMSAA